LFQLKYKKTLDTSLLTAIILQNSDSNEFFINKAIGWILREYSKTNPKWVKNFIESYALHPLSVREGCKYL
jgi:3-methyladenine DNA glycosylase AlkD